MRSFLSIALLFITIQIFPQAMWTDSSFVHRDGRQIKDAYGNSIILEGFNLGGWLMWEGWIWNGAFTQQKTIFNSISTELSPLEAENFRDSIYWNYITREDIQRISQECYNVVRIPFNHDLLEDDWVPYTYKPEGWAVLDSILSWCEEFNVYAILDLHSAPGGQSNLFTADPDFLINLWNGAINQTRTANLWKAIAERYKDRGIIAGYDLLNEPDAPNDTMMLEMYQRIIDSIRTVDINHMLFIEGSQYATDFSIFSTPPDDNIVYEFHMYTWFISDIRNEVNQYTLLSQAQNTPIWCGEWGENVYDELDSTIHIFRDTLYGLSGSAFWTYKKAKRNNNYPFYSGIDTTSLWNKTITWICDNFQPKPDTNEMRTGMNEFIQKIKYSNCVFDDSLVSILSPCTPASLNENLFAPLLEIYPNPSNGLVFVSAPELHGYAIVNILNSEGKLIQQLRNDFSKNNLININAIPGLYLIQIEDGQGNKFLGRFIIE